MESLGDRVRRLREALGLSRADLASAAGISAQQVASIESGETKQPGLIAGVKLARRLGVRVDYLATGEGPMERAADAAALHAVTPPAIPLSRVDELVLRVERLERALHEIALAGAEDREAVARGFEQSVEIAPPSGAGSPRRKSGGRREG